MSDVLQRLEDAKELVRQIQEEAKNSDCSVVGCDWVSIGGANGGCHEDCFCSVPVHECSKCGDCDYGHNKEANEIRSECLERTGC